MTSEDARSEIKAALADGGLKWEELAAEVSLSDRDLESELLDMQSDGEIEHRVRPGEYHLTDE